MTYPPEDFYDKMKDSVEHRTARAILSAIAIAMGIFAVPLVTKGWEVLILIICIVGAVTLLLDDLTWIIKWLISQHSTRRPK